MTMITERDESKNIGEKMKEINLLNGNIKNDHFFFSLFIY
jgi:hypothetical protein